jgi:hypothetical protein
MGTEDSTKSCHLKDMTNKPKSRPGTYESVRIVGSISRGTVHDDPSYNEDDARLSATFTMVPRKPGKTRSSLPLTFITPSGQQPENNCFADTGSDVNVLPEAFARHCGYETSDFKPSRYMLQLATGQIVEPIGELVMHFWFGTRLEPTEGIISCIFHVLPRAPSIFVGVSLLHQTKTMTEHRYRLVQIPRPNFEMLSVCSVGKPRMHIVCDINHRITVAVVDSGSEVDLVSPQFVQDRDFEVHPVEEVIELADGSVVVSYGFIRTTVSIGTHFDSMHAPMSKVARSIDLFLLESLNHDVILGEYTLDQLFVFTDNQHALVLASDAKATMELNRIRDLGPLDRALSWFKNKLNPRSGRDDEDSR